MIYDDFVMKPSCYEAPSCSLTKLRIRHCYLNDVSLDGQPEGYDIDKEEFEWE